METIAVIILPTFFVKLVRRAVAQGATPAETTWRWAIVAEGHERNLGERWVYSPAHWRETKGAEQPFRPWNELSFIETYEIDPSKSDGWKQTRESRAAIASRRAHKLERERREAVRKQYEGGAS